MEKAVAIVLIGAVLLAGCDLSGGSPSEYNAVVAPYTGELVTALTNANGEVFFESQYHQRRIGLRIADTNGNAIEGYAVSYDEYYDDLILSGFDPEQRFDTMFARGNLEELAAAGLAIEFEASSAVEGSSFTVAIGAAIISFVIGSVFAGTQYYLKKSDIQSFREEALHAFYDGRKLYSMNFEQIVLDQSATLFADRQLAIDMGINIAVTAVGPIVHTLKWSSYLGKAIEVAAASRDMVGVTVDLSERDGEIEENSLSADVDQLLYEFISQTVGEGRSESEIRNHTYYVSIGLPEPTSHQVYSPDGIGLLSRQARVQWLDIYWEDPTLHSISGVYAGTATECPGPDDWYFIDESEVHFGFKMVDETTFIITDTYFAELPELTAENGYGTFDPDTNIYEGTIHGINSGTTRDPFIRDFYMDFEMAFSGLERTTSAALVTARYHDLVEGAVSTQYDILTFQQQ